MKPSNKEITKSKSVKSQIQIEYISSQSEVIDKTDNETEELYYFPIYKHNIYEYFSKGLFTPTFYSINRVYKDLQDLNPKSIIITSKPIKVNDQEYVNIGLMFRSYEIKQFSKNDAKSVYEYSKPIPISRVVSILVNNLETKNELLSKANDESTGPLNSEHFLLSDNFENIELDIPQNSDTIEPLWLERIDTFESILGATSILRNSGYFYPSSGTIANYSNEYLMVLNEFKLLSFENSVYTWFLCLYDRVRKPKDLLEDFISWFSKNNNLNKDTLIEYLNETNFISDKDKASTIKNFSEIIDSSFANKKALEYQDNDKNIQQLLKVMSLTYNNQNLDSLEGFITNLNEGHIKPVLGNTILALLGSYHGYVKLRPYVWLEALRDGTDFSDVDLQHRTLVKYNLSAQLDYSIIEYIYMDVFCKAQPKSEFKLLQKSSAKLPKINCGREYKFIIERATLGQQDVKVKITLRNIKNTIDSNLSKYPEEIDIDKYLYVMILKYKIAEQRVRVFDECKTKLYFKKSDLIDELQKAFSNELLEELVSIVKLDGYLDDKN